MIFLLLLTVAFLTTPLFAHSPFNQKVCDSASESSQQRVCADEKLASAKKKVQDLMNWYDQTLDFVDFSAVTPSVTQRVLAIDATRYNLDQTIQNLCSASSVGTSTKSVEVSLIECATSLFEQRAEGLESLKGTWAPSSIPSANKSL